MVDFYQHKGCNGQEHTFSQLNVLLSEVSTSTPLPLRDSGAYPQYRRDEKQTHAVVATDLAGPPCKHQVGLVMNRLFSRIR